MTASWNCHSHKFCDVQNQRSWRKSAFRDYLWDNKLDSWDFIFIGNVQNSELGIEIKITYIFRYFSEQSHHIVNSYGNSSMIELIKGNSRCYQTDAYVQTFITWLYAHSYAEKTIRERNEKSWELSERSNTINTPFLANGRFLVKWPCFKIKPFS